MIEVKDVMKTFNRGKTNAYKALRGVSLTIKDGEMVAIIGTSGAGKSTLLHILACIEGYDSGKYTIDGTMIDNISEQQKAHIRNEKVGIVMQDFALVEDFTAQENVMIPLDFAQKSVRKKIKERKKTALQMLELVQMKEYAGKPVKKLSGGQKQRVAIARAIANEPTLLLADEPTGALDSKTTEEIMKLFCELNQQGKTLIIVTHDIKIAQQCNRIIEIADGRIVG